MACFIQDSMREVAEEKKSLARERGSLHEGVPAITVIVGANEHKHSCNAKSGVAIIMGKETGKLLYVHGSAKQIL